MAPEVALVPVTGRTSETLTVLKVGHRRWLSAGGGEPDHFPDIAERIRSGRMIGALLPDPSGGAAGLALWARDSPVGRRAFLVLNDGLLNAAALATLVDRVRDYRTGGPLLSIDDPIQGIPDDVAEEVLVPRGFVRIVRQDFVYPAEAPLPDAPPAPATVRRLERADEGGLARLLAESYADYPLDLALFRRYEDPEADLTAASRFLLGDELGTWWSEASFGLPDPRNPGRLLAAIVVNDYLGPLISELGVVPEARRGGLARHLLRRSIEAVRRRTKVPVRLVVTLSNGRAHRLYRSMGFLPVEAAKGGQWIDPVALKISTLSAPEDPSAP